MNHRTPQVLTTAIALLLALAACAPEVGSDAWCENMADKPKGDWSINEATEFAKSCIVKNYE